MIRYRTHLLSRLTLVALIAITYGCGGEEAAKNGVLVKTEIDAPTDQSDRAERIDEEYGAEYRTAADLVRQHYTAISRDSYRRAFDLWVEGSREFNEFTTEAEKIDRAVVSFDRSGRAGILDDRLVVEVPVMVQIRMAGGAEVERHEVFLIQQQSGGVWKILESREE